MERLKPSYIRGSFFLVYEFFFLLAFRRLKPQLVKSCFCRKTQYPITQTSIYTPQSLSSPPKHLSAKLSLSLQHISWIHKRTTTAPSGCLCSCTGVVLVDSGHWRQVVPAGVKINDNRRANLNKYDVWFCGVSPVGFVGVFVVLLPPAKTNGQRQEQAVSIQDDCKFYETEKASVILK